MNIAIRGDVFDDIFEVLDTSVFRVVDYLGYGLYVVKPERKSATILADGTFDWEAQGEVPVTISELGDETVDPAYVGWRKS